jgi:hypothetical protein
MKNRGVDLLVHYTSLTATSRMHPCDTHPTAELNPQPHIQTRDVYHPAELFQAPTHLGLRCSLHQP